MKKYTLKKLLSGKEKNICHLRQKNKRACHKLSEIDQSVFAAHGKSVIYPVPNKWRKQGWTIVAPKEVDPDIFADALTTAYGEAAPHKLSKQVRQDDVSG